MNAKAPKTPVQNLTNSPKRSQSSQVSRRAKRRLAFAAALMAMGTEATCMAPAFAQTPPPAPAAASPSVQQGSPDPNDHPTAAGAQAVEGKPAEERPGSGHGRGDGTGHGRGDGSGSGVPHEKGHGPAAHGGTMDGHEAQDEHGGAAAHGEHGAQAGHDGHEGAHGGHEDHDGPPKAINWADFGNKEQPPFAAFLINFVLLVGLYLYFGRKPVADGLKKRRADIAKEIEEAQRIKAEAEARAKTYQAKLASLETELAEARAALVEAGRGERDRIVREAEERAARMTRDAVTLVEQEAKQMRADLVRETVAIAMGAAEEILRASVTSADQERLADEFLRDLASKSQTGGAAPAQGPSQASGGLS